MIKKNIKFRAKKEFFLDAAPRPVPASKLIPSWWKKIPKYSQGHSIKLNPVANVTVKQCAPVLDAMVSGYLLLLPADIVVSRDNDILEIRWRSTENIADVWPPHQVSEYSIPWGYSDTVFKLENQWIIETPRGWSTLFTEPFGYQNSPIKALPGIVDTDILETDINCPFVIRNDFEGLIPAGTPIVQMIPIRRSSWESVFDFIPNNEMKKRVLRLSSKAYKYYSSIRERKRFS